MKYSPKSICPCGSAQTYGKCCARYHRGERPEQPEALMRSRYTAYALKMPGYIMETTHPDGPQYRGDLSAWRKDIEKFCRATMFKALRVEEVIGDADGEQGFVTFHATLYVGKEDYSFREKSLFLRHDGRWKYHSGEQLGHA